MSVVINNPNPNKWNTKFIDPCIDASQFVGKRFFKLGIRFEKGKRTFFVPFPMVDHVLRSYLWPGLIQRFPYIGSYSVDDQVNIVVIEKLCLT